MVLTEFGMVMASRRLQHSNALSPIVITELGMVTDVSLSQPENALSPIAVTWLGIVKLSSFLHFAAFGVARSYE